MLEQKKIYPYRHYLFNLVCLVLALLVITFKARADFEDDNEIFILEPVIQDFTLQDFAYAYKEGENVYISLPQIASYTGLKYELNGSFLRIWLNGEDSQPITLNMDKHFIITTSDTQMFPENGVQIFDDTVFISTDIWAILLQAEIKVDRLNMQLIINKETDFPTITLLKAEKNRKKGLYSFKTDGFENYEFDNRLLGSPVVDVTLGKGWGHSHDNKQTFNSDSYAITLAMLAGGLDINSYFAGDSYSDRKPSVRLSGSRTFLDEPSNALNLKTLKIGDLNGLSSSYFTNTSYGRGVAVSSFKNLVMSANKTIDITGPLADGWQVELFWNEQLVGYRQNSTNGQYNFPNIPVSYGLNTFKLVFYGPYGETRTEYERYYSGTSPVKKGEFGYNLAAYQPYRYLIENNEPYKYDGSNTPIIDMTGYYGVTDKLTLMGGITQTPDAEKHLETQHFGMVGAQYALQGSSIQSNLEQNMDTDKFAIHTEWQGDVYVGNIYAGYDKYNGIHSPISYFGKDYLDEQLEARFSGMLPYSVPYYLSWKTGTLENDNSGFKSFSARLSKQILNGLNLTVEDNYYDYENGSKPNNTIRLGAYKWWGNFSSETWLEYATSPKSKFTEFSTRLDWRTGRNTYISGKYTRNIPQNMDYFSFSGGHIFPFGGLTATLETDRNFNLSSYLTYNISFAKAPDEMNIITSANSKLSQSGTIYAKVFDETGSPIEGIGLNANGLEKEVFTDEHGVAVLRDLQTYEKTIVDIDMETLIDIALQPQKEETKLVLHPGTIRTIYIPFIHRGAIEGKISNAQNIRMFGYKIAAMDKYKNELSYTYADIEGYFILDNIPFGKYNLIISKDNNILAELQDIVVDDNTIFIPDEIMLDWKGALFFENADSEKELEKLENDHLDGLNNKEYLNNTFPIALSHPETLEMLEIKDIEGDIFSKTKEQPYSSYTLQEIEQLIFSIMTR